MKETIAEYSRIIIVGVAFALMLAFIFGGIWFNKLGQASNVMNNNVAQDKQQTILDKIDDVYPPQLNVVGKTYKVGELIKLSDLIEEAYSEELSVDKETGEVTKVRKDMKEYVEISSDSEYYHKDSQTLIPMLSGLYDIEYKLKDDYGQTTRKTIHIVVEN